MFDITKEFGMEGEEGRERKRDTDRDRDGGHGSCANFYVLNNPVLLM